MSKESRNAWLKSPKGRYYQHKCSAKRRGIPFHLTFEEWMEVWGSKYELRGAGGYVMCRNGDTGPYAVGNVFIATGADNTRDADPAKFVSNGKLNAEKAAAIKEDLAAGVMVKECAAKYGVSRQSISDIKAGRTWQ